jgi:putative peptide zinc metalloprotease protein
LLRYDGYYIFADLLELPNLRMRAQGYVAYLCERYLFGRRNAESEAATPAERVWFVSYAIASFVYRLFVLVAITLFIASRFFFVGVLIAVGGIIFGVSVPLAKFLTYVGTSPRLRRVRWRAVLVTAGAGRCSGLGTGAITHPGHRGDLGSGTGHCPCRDRWHYRAGGGPTWSTCAAR